MNQPSYLPPGSYAEKPGMVTTVMILTLISGILNILLALGLTATIVLGTFGIGLLCAPITILPGILGIFEILYAVKLMSNPPQPVVPSQALAIMEICMILFGNIVSTVAGILALVFYNDITVKTYFAKINGQPQPSPYPMGPNNMGPSA